MGRYSLFMDGSKKSVENRGYETAMEETAGGVQILTGRTQILTGKRGVVEFAYGDNGNGYINKPNGTRKWYYEVSIAKFSRYLLQVEESYR